MRRRQTWYRAREVSKFRIIEHKCCKPMVGAECVVFDEFNKTIADALVRARDAGMICFTSARGRAKDAND